RGYLDLLKNFKAITVGQLNVTKHQIWLWMPLEPVNCQCYALQGAVDLGMGEHGDNQLLQSCRRWLFIFYEQYLHRSNLIRGNYTLNSSFVRCIFGVSLHRKLYRRRMFFSPTPQPSDSSLAFGCKLLLTINWLFSFLIVMRRGCCSLITLCLM